jgi:hypothetical protein
MRIPIIVAVAVLVLCGCDANQGVNLSSHCPGAVADCNPYAPTSFAQNNTGIGGGGH